MVLAVTEHMQLKCADKSDVPAGNVVSWCELMLRGCCKRYLHYVAL